MPLGWWAFIDESASEDATVITDPYHSDRKFVTITQSFLRVQINRFVSKDIKVLLDIHAFPGGSAEGSYNGIFPNQPKFFFERRSRPDAAGAGARHRRESRGLLPVLRFLHAGRDCGRHADERAGALMRRRGYGEHADLAYRSYHAVEGLGREQGSDPPRRCT